MNLSFGEICTPASSVDTNGQIFKFFISVKESDLSYVREIIYIDLRMI